MTLLVEQPASTAAIGRIGITLDGCKKPRELPGPHHRERDDLLRFESSRNAVDANWGKRFGGL